VVYLNQYPKVYMKELTHNNLSPWGEPNAGITKVYVRCTSSR